MIWSRSCGSFFDESNFYAAAGEVVDEGAEVLEVAVEPVEGVDVEGVSGADVAEHRLESFPVGVLAGHSIGEDDSADD